jgi:phenylalanyl-tRNA synthetase alpha chain
MDIKTIEQQLLEVRTKALEELSRISDTKVLEAWRVEYLGKKSPVSQISRQMGSLDAETRPVVGTLIHHTKSELTTGFENAKAELDAKILALRLQKETIDITLPGHKKSRGAMHPISRTLQEIEDVFLGMGFEIAEGPEVETDAYNFEMLNVPKDHPARDMQDTFYITEELLMRTHTSPMQVRTMERVRPRVPVKVIVPGRVYRRDEDDATHSHAFTQIEGLVVDRNIRMSDLKGVLENFAKAVFGHNQAVRLRPSFFPFTEPSAEVDLLCIQCGGSGCRVCKETGWIEILGAGMVHPNVLDAAGYDSKQYSGFAFGMGAERIAMLKYGISDIRLLYQNDLRFLHQFTRAL